MASGYRIVIVLDSSEATAKLQAWRLILEIVRRLVCLAEMGAASNRSSWRDRSGMLKLWAITRWRQALMQGAARLKDGIYGSGRAGVNMALTNSAVDGRHLF